MPNDVVTGQFSIIRKPPAYQDRYRHIHFLLVFGDSGNESKQFHINGIAAPVDGQTMVGGTNSSNPFRR
jgi:hypothetical protein